MNNNISLQSLQLSASDLSNLTKMAGSQWPDQLISDYLTTFTNLENIVMELQSVISKISKNTADIKSNSGSISVNEKNISDHVTSKSAHDVLGDNVGTNNFATRTVGGTVLLCPFVKPTGQSTAIIEAPDIVDAPELYDKSYAQSQTNLINETKSKHNLLLLDLNKSLSVIDSLITELIVSKQMENE